jgi:hypothetical protein
VLYVRFATIETQAVAQFEPGATSPPQGEIAVPAGVSLLALPQVADVARKW